MKVSYRNDSVSRQRNGSIVKSAYGENENESKMNGESRRKAYRRSEA
jgi:hypothetical protein